LTYRLKKLNYTTLNSKSKNECKNLVIYGSNLYSTLKYKNFNSKLRNISQIPTHLYPLITGLLLSDGWLYKNKSNKTLLALKQKDFEYLLFVYFKFAHYCRSLPIINYSSLNGKKFVALTFATRVYPCFTEWYNIFYKDGKKIVPLDLYYMLTYEVLAHWIMGDGTKR
jgi:hypothetical protein